MKTKTYTIEVKCNKYRFAKIQKAIREILPSKTKRLRLLDIYGASVTKYIKDGLNASEILNALKYSGDTQLEPVTKQEVYTIIKDLGFVRTYTKTK